VNLVTDGLPGIALGLDPVGEDIMKRKPVSAESGLFSGKMPFLIIFRGILIGLCTLGAFALVNYTTGNVDAARTTAFMTLVMAQIVHSLECRSETKGLFQSGVRDNLWLLSAGAFSLLMMLAVVYVPALQGVFKTIELSVSQLGIVACFTAVGPILGGIVNEIFFLAEK
jgi:Ca2+-transporting ATPase